MGRRKTKKKSGCLGEFFRFFIVLILIGSLFGTDDDQSKGKQTSAVTATTTVSTTARPIVKATAKPTVKPTAVKTAKPTATPTVEPTPVPTVEPTATPTADPTEEPVITYAKVNKAVNIRKEPNADSKKMGSARVGESFIITQAYYTDKWHQIDYNGQICYMSAKYCDIVEGSAVASTLALASTATAVRMPVEEPEDTSIYIGNRNTKKFHEEYCSSVDDMKEKNKVTFTSREAAVKKGYVPCKRCDP